MCTHFVVTGGDPSHTLVPLSRVTTSLYRKRDGKTVLIASRIDLVLFYVAVPFRLLINCSVHCNYGVFIETRQWKKTNARRVHVIVVVVSTAETVLSFFKTQLTMYANKFPVHNISTHASINVCEWISFLEKSTLVQDYPYVFNLFTSTFTTSRYLYLHWVLSKSRKGLRPMMNVSQLVL